jgi:chromosome segregation ATPase
MDSESNSDEMTSAENFSNHDNKSCPVCRLNFEAQETESSVCDICSKRVCESCSSFQEKASTRYCNKCQKYLSYISSTTLQQLQAETLTNQELTAKLITLQKELQQGKNRLKDLSEEMEKLEEKKTVISLLRQESEENQKKIQKLSLEIKNLSSEKDELESLLIEKDAKIDKVNQELLRLRAEILECKKNSNFIPPGCGELYIENKDLKEKIKELEQDHCAYTQQMIDALELLKAQLFREKSQNIDLMNIIESSNEKENKASLENERINLRELQEELRLAKKQLELMRASRIEEAGFEPLSTDKFDGPDSTPCKCVVF